LILLWMPWWPMKSILCSFFFFDYTSIAARPILALTFPWPKVFHWVAGFTQHPRGDGRPTGELAIIVSGRERCWMLLWWGRRYAPSTSFLRTSGVAVLLINPDRQGCGQGHIHSEPNQLG
jgi:hypothetical protein